MGYVVGEAKTQLSSLQAEFRASYADLLARFGPPQYSPTEKGYGDGKVSTEWIFTCEKTGNVFTLYDYKETSLYDEENPSVEEFRAQPFYDWHVGGGADPSDFTSWLRARLNEPPPAPPAPPGPPKTPAEHLDSINETLG